MKITCSVEKQDTKDRQFSVFRNKPWGVRFISNGNLFHSKGTGKLNDFRPNTVVTLGTLKLFETHNETVHGNSMTVFFKDNDSDVKFDNDTFF